MATSSLESVEKPYELLFRWRGGELTGIHTQFCVVTYRDGQMVGELPDVPRPAASGDPQVQEMLSEAFGQALDKIAELEQMVTSQAGVIEELRGMLEAQ